MRTPAVILVVEDNEAGLTLLRAVLEVEGFLVDSAGSADEVLEQLNVRRPDLILMDVQLPGEDGLTITRRLKANPATTAIPIVALTAHAMAGDREKALFAGCIDYITKPIDTRTLAYQIRKFLPVTAR
jgi:two-component system, cell cycle response regulator DivK